MSVPSFIQLIGTQRSGSNLLRLMLNEHSEISAPHPPHLLRTFIPIIESYGDLQDPSKIKILTEDMCRWVEANPVPWEGVQLDPGEIASKARDIFDVFREIYRQKMVADHATIACCKSMANVYFLDQIETRFAPFYIYIYRDGRDVAASFQRAIIGEKHVYHLAKKWDEQQQRSMAFLEQLDEKRFAKVSYEDLIHDPEAILFEICSKLDITFEPHMLTYYQSRESKLTASSGRMWGNVTKPVLSDNTGNFRERLTREEIDIFEQIAESSLLRLGYSPLLNGEPRVPIDIERFDLLNEEAKSRALQKAPASDRAKRKPQQDLWREINTKFKIESDDD